MAAEITALKELQAGESWRSPTGAKAFDFLHQGAYCVALTMKLSDYELDQLEMQSESTVESVEVPGAIFLYLADCMNLRPIQNNPLLIEEYIGGPAGSDGGVELDVVQNFLESITVFKIKDKSIFKLPTSDRYVANYICTFDSNLNRASRLTPNSLDTVRRIFLQEKDHLIAQNLFEAMGTPKLRHAFLEVYRTLEFVFVLPRANALLGRLRDVGGKLDINVIDFARYCNTELGWKRAERDSIDRLFQEYAAADFSCFLALASNCQPFSGFAQPLTSCDPKERKNFVEKVAEKYYSLRNQVAHQFWPEEEAQCNDDDWNALIEFTLGAVAYFYEQHLSRTA